jgi:hypothetical protein
VCGLHQKGQPQVNLGHVTRLDCRGEGWPCHDGSGAFVTFVNV